MAEFEKHSMPLAADFKKDALIDVEKRSLASFDSSSSTIAPNKDGEICFAIGKSKGGRHYYVHQDGPKGAVVYNATVHNWKRGAPSVELRKGEADSAPVVGFTRIDCAGHNSQIALGDSARPDSPSVSYDMMTTRSFTFKEYPFSSDELSARRDHRQYTWIRTKNVPARFECRDVETGAVLAEFRSNGLFKWTKLGAFAVTAPDATPRMIEYLLLVFLTWSEMENRESAVLGAIAS